jgi:hypothetical protein
MASKLLSIATFDSHLSQEQVDQLKLWFTLNVEDINVYFTSFDGGKLKIKYETNSYRVNDLNFKIFAVFKTNLAQLSIFFIDKDPVSLLPQYCDDYNIKEYWTAIKFVPIKG